MTWLSKFAPKIRSAIRPLLILFVFIYAGSLTFSIAGMEIASFTITILFGIYVCFDFFSRKKTIQWHTIGAEFPILGFLIVVATGLLIKSPFEDFWPAFGSLRNLVLIFILAYTLQVVKNLNKLIGMIIFLAFIVAVYAIWQHYMGIDLWRDGKVLLSNQYGGVRVYQSYGFFSHHLTFADSYAMLIAFPFATLLLSSKWEIWKRLIALVVFGVFLAAIIFTYSRGAWIALAVALPIMAFFVSRKLLLWLLLIASISTGIIFKYDTALKARALSIFEISTNKQEDERRMVWSANMEMFKDNPWIGVGYKQNEPLTPKYYDKMGIKDGFSGHAHSNYLEMLSTTGIIGTVFYMLFILAFVLMTARLYTSIPKTHFWHRVFALAILGGQIAFHVGGLTQWNFGDGEVQHQFCFWLAVMSYMGYRYYAHIVPDDRSL